MMEPGSGFIPETALFGGVGSGFGGGAQYACSVELARMYRGKSPDLPLNGLFGVTTLELG